MRNKLVSSLLTLVLVVAMFAGVAPVAAESQDENTGEKVMTKFDLKTFINSQPNSKLSYDYLKLATALQGLVNRTEPQLFFMYESNYVAKSKGMDTDQFWLDQLTEEGEYLNSFQVETVDEFETLLDRFSDYYNGVVVWDSEVPATANVASTAAGVDNLLPVRYDPTPGSPYDVLVNTRNIPVVLDLVGKFTGEGSIPDIDIPSTGSAKNDAYQWAKAKYLDTGKTNPALLTFALDAISWSTGETEFNSQLTAFALPDKMKAGDEVEVSVTLQNNGKATWSYGTNDRLGAQGTNEFGWGNLNGGFNNAPTNQRVFLNEGEPVEPGDSYTFTFSIIAPNEAGTYEFNAKMVRDGVTWYGNEIKKQIEVITDDAEVAPPVEVQVPPAGDFVYPDLFNTFLPNADYFISNKAFFFDLSPDKTSYPIDDRNQPLGTDYDTLIDIFRSQNELAGEQIITLGGFVPWWLKYTNHADPEANLAPVQAEWLFLDVISQYNIQKDADAFGLIGLSNASVYDHVPLNEELIQKNDKGNNDKTYDRDTKYVTFYMGDYDSGAWTTGALPALWNDPKRGEIPLGWPVVPGLSKRVPHVYNYLYETMSPNDYFIAGDNGAGYLNPMMLMEENRPDGLPDFLHVWEEYNIEYYNKFDMDITGFLISGRSGTVPERVQEVYSRISPHGVGNNGGFEKNVVNGTPFARVVDLGHEERDPVAYGERIANAIQRGNQQFFNFRNILTSPGVIVDAINYVKETYPELNFEVIDPYTYYRFYEEAEGWLVPAPEYYDAEKTINPVQIDGNIDTGEWDNAVEIDVSPDSDVVQKVGTVWGAEDNAEDLTSKYRIQWDEEYLYVLEERQDDSLNFTETGAQMYLSDATMLFLDLDHNRAGLAFRDGDYALYMTPSGPDGQPHMFVREGHNDGQVEKTFENGIIASNIQENGYTMEVAIPWSELQVMPFAPEQDKLVGMTLLATDNDGPGNWGQIMWVGAGDDQALWADMKFAVKDFTVEERIQSLTKWLESEEIGTPLHSQLTNRINQVTHHYENGRTKQASKHLRDFQKHLNNPPMSKHISDQLKDRLNSLSDELLTTFDEM